MNDEEQSQKWTTTGHLGLEGIEAIADLAIAVAHRKLLEIKEGKNGKLPPTTIPTEAPNRTHGIL